MHLLFVIDNLNTGGAQRQMVNLALGLRQRKHSIDFFCYYPENLLAGPLLDAKIPVFAYAKKGRFSPGVILALRNQIKNGQYDVVLSFLDTPNFYNIVTSHLLLKRPRIVVSERLADPPGGSGKAIFLLRQFFRFADQVVINSSHHSVNLLKKYPWLNGHTTTIYNGYDLDFFHPPSVEPDNHLLKLLCVARTEARKNGLCVIEALSILRTKYQLFPIVDWAGQKTPPYQQQMEESIASHGLQNQWNWLGQRTDIVPLLQQHDALIHASYLEGLPNAVCEALACGRPVIVSDAMDHPTLVQNGENGFLFDWRNPEKLADAIWNFSQLSVEQRHEMGMRGRLYAEKNLALTHFTDQYEHLFASLITKNNP